MKCPVCNKSENHIEIEVHSNGFAEEIIHCEICGSLWAINHGVMEVVRDAQAKSFLSATTECVEADDYCLVA
jgi:uncharacterized Zn finger protein